MKNEKTVNAKAVYFSGKETVEIQTEQIHRIPETVLVESEYIGISHGTEMLFYRGEVPEDIPVDATLEPLAGELRYPIKYGYINTGRDEQGRNVFAFYPHQDTFFINESELLVLPEEMDTQDALFIPNVETALSIHQDCLIEPGGTLLISGLGVVGLMITEIAVRRHFGTIICLDPIERRRAAAEALGATVLDPSEPDLKARIKEAARGECVDWAVNISSSGEGLQNCIDSLGFGATVIEGSWYGKKPVSLRLGSNFHRNRITIKSVQVSSLSPRLSGRWTKTRRMETVFSLIRQINPKKYITHRFPLEEVSEAFRLLSEKPETTIQTILIP